MAIDVSEMSASATTTLGQSRARPSFDDTTEMGGAVGLISWFRAEGLTVPPIPATLGPRLEQVAPTVWSTHELDPWRLVDNDRAIAGLERTGHLDQLTVGHVSRRSDTSRITYQLALRGLGIVATCFWREQRRSHDAGVIDQTFFALDALLTDLRPALEDHWGEQPGLLVEAHGRSVRWWRPDHDLGCVDHTPEAGASWASLARNVCVDPPGWRVRVLDHLPRP